MQAADADRPRHRRPPLRIALALGLALLVISTLVLHFGYHWTGHTAHLPFLDAVYFTVETVATVGFGDFSFSGSRSASRRSASA